MESERKKYLDLKQSMDVEFELFLLPNDAQSGDFESILEWTIAEKHRKIIDCLAEFEKCIGQYNEYVIPNRKARMFAYVTSFKRNKNDQEEFKNKGNWFFESTEIWNFSDNNQALKPLKDFILEHCPALD